MWYIPNSCEHLKVDYFHDFFPKVARLETVVYNVPKDISFPEGNYAFLELFCCNPDCDCKEVVIEIEPQTSVNPLKFEIAADPTAILKYAFAEPLSDKNPIIHENSAESPWAKTGLEILKDYLKNHPEYTEKLCKHYSKMKHTGKIYRKRPEELFQTTAPQIRQEPKIGRNDPCPCGSGKKHKKCCMKISPDSA